MSIRARVLGEGGPRMWERFMAELREDHVGTPKEDRSEPDGESVAATLQAAYEEVLAKSADQ